MSRTTRRKEVGLELGDQRLSVQKASIVSELDLNNNDGVTLQNYS
jgi:hypothetical protein